MGVAVKRAGRYISRADIIGAHHRIGVPWSACRQADTMDSAHVVGISNVEAGIGAGTVAKPTSDCDRAGRIIGEIDR